MRVDPGCLQISQGPIQQGRSICRPCLSAHVLSLGYDAFQVSGIWIDGGKNPEIEIL